MTATVPILWMALAAAAAPGTDAQAQPLSSVPVLPSADEWGAPPRPIEIVLVGPEPDRHDMQVAIQAVVGADVELTWSARDALPGDAPLVQPNSGNVSQIWIDVTDLTRVRIISPARAPTAPPIVRIVEMPVSADQDQQPVIREAVAQIVSATVRAFLDAPTARPPRLAFVPAPPPAPRLAPDNLDVVRRAPIADTAEVPAQPAYSLAMVAGAHSSPFLLGERYKQSNWLGPALVLSLRRETPRMLLEGRFAVENSERSTDTIDLKSQLYSVVLAASRRLTAGRFTFSLGLELGALIFRQQTSEILAIDSGVSSLPSLQLPGQLGTTWSMGLVGGPIGEASIALTPRWFLHLVVGLPVAVANASDGNVSSWHSSWYTQVLGGVGAYL